MELGFAIKLDDKLVNIPIKQLKQIINIDETCLALDGGSGKYNGHPAIVQVGNNLPDGKSIFKVKHYSDNYHWKHWSQQSDPSTFSFLDDSHFQRKDVNLFRLIAVHAKCEGCNTVKEWPVTFRINLKGGMDDAKYE